MASSASEDTARKGNPVRSSTLGTRPKRSRIAYREDPDYTKPLLEIPGEAREKIFSKLRFLYGEDNAKAAMPELERILRVHHAHKSQQRIEAEKDLIPMRSTRSTSCLFFPIPLIGVFPWWTTPAWIRNWERGKTSVR
jgi:hypothetical protein